MGITPSQQRCIEAAHPFFGVKLDIVAKEGWEAFFESAEAFAIDSKQWADIALHVLSIERSEVDSEDHRATAKRLFFAFDPDSNGRVDAGELFTAFALMAEGSTRDRARFFFRLMDYDDNEHITIDEVLISLKSILVGALKLRNQKALPNDDMVLQIAERFFDMAVLFCQDDGGAASTAGSDSEAEASLAPHENPNARLSEDEFVRFCVQCPSDEGAASLVSSLPAGLRASSIAVVDLLLLCNLRDMVALGLDIDSDIEQEVSKSGVGASLLPGSDNEAAPSKPRRRDEDGEGDEDDPFAGGPAEGDEFMAVKPWLGAIKAPSRPPPTNPAAPELTADIEWVHGYRAQDCRSNLRYSAEGHAVYHAAALGIVYDADKHEQWCHRFHTDDIISLAVSPDGRYAATGQLGKKPSVCVWRTGRDGAAETVARLRGFHERGVPQLAFSPDGSRLVTVGLDKNNSVAVYAVDGPDGWEEAAQRPPLLQFRAKGNAAKPLSVSWASDDAFAICGVKSMFVYTGDGKGGFKAKKGLFGRKTPLQTLLCAAYPADGPCVTGTLSGDLYLWSGRSCCGIVSNAHKGAVNASYCGRRLLLTGGKDGCVCVWDAGKIGPRMAPLARLDLNKQVGALELVSAQVRSVCVDEKRGKVLVGTKGSEVVELDFGGADPSKWADLLASSRGTARVLIRGHCADELWGLAVHPSGQGFATSGDDKTLRVWDVRTRRMVQLARLPAMSRAVAYSPDGQQLAVGLGGRVGRGQEKGDGGVLFLPSTLDAAPSSIVHAQDSKQWISDVKFSPTGDMVAVGSHDNRVYIYHSKHKRLVRRLQGHSSYITHLDFSRDGSHLQSNCGAYELLFWRVGSGEQITSASSLRDTWWHTWTCTLGWPVQGIWEGGADGTDVNAVDRASHRAHPALLATGDDSGRVRLFRYPCVEERSSSVDCTGHSSHVMNVRWLPGCEANPEDGDTVVRRLISVGGNDRCIIQWRCVVDSADVDAAASGSGAAPVELSPSVAGITEADAELHAQAGPGGAEDDPFAGGPAEGDEFMAVKPWVGAIVAPSVAPSPPKHAPSDAFKLEWVHGYRAQDCRSNLRYSGQGRVVYHAAALGISLDAGKGPADTPSQRFNMEHDDDVVSLAVSPDGAFVATGQLGRRPKVVVWDAETGKTEVVLQGFHKRAVTDLAFSPDGKLLATVGLDDNHSVAVYDWRAGVLRAKSKGDRGKVLDLTFGADSSSFAQCGIKHARMWSLSKGSLASKKALFGKGGPPRACVAAAYWGDGYAMGTSEGEIVLFRGRQAVGKAVAAHAAPVGCLFAHDRLGLLSGGSDGVLACLPSRSSEEARAVALFSPMSDKARGKHPLAASLKEAADLAPAIHSMDGDVRSVCVHESGTRMLVGTRGSDIVEVPLDKSGAVAQRSTPRVLARGHCADELWGLAVHPSQREYATVGDDKTLRVWDVRTRRQLWAAALPTMSRAVAYSPDGQQLALGLGGRVGRGRQRGDGGVLLVRNSPDNAQSLQVIKKWRDSKQWISDVKFSPDGQMLAVGSHDNRIYLYDLNSLRLRHTLVAHSSYITHLDFSEDGTALQSNCGAYELLFWDLRSGQQNTSASSLKDTWWHTWTCTLGWPVQGIWEAGADGTDVNAVERLTPRDWARLVDGAASGSAKRGAEALKGLSQKRRDAGLLATVDDNGKVNLYHYPNPEEKAKHCSMGAHSSHVMNVRWMVPVPGESIRPGMATDNAIRLLTVGGNDRCIMQWFAGDPEQQRGEPLRELRAASALWALGCGTELREEDEEGEDEHGGMAAGGALSGYAADDEDAVGGGAGAFAGSDADEGDEDDPFAGGPAEGDEFMAVKPWVGTVEHTRPTNPPPVDASAPAETPSLEWVYGYQGENCTGNVAYNVNGEVVYHAAAVGVIYNASQEQHSQEHHLGHTNDILSFAMAPNGRLAATGQVRDTLTPRALAHVRVWDADTGALVSALPGEHKNAVRCLAFSPSGKQLATVGADSYHRVALYSSASGTWTDARAGATSNGDRAATLFAVYDTESELYTGGAKHVRAWSLEGGKLRSRQVSFGKSVALVGAMCGAANPAGGGVFVGAIVAGEGKRRLGPIFHVAGGRATAVAENAHEDGATALYATARGGRSQHIVVSGGRDGCVRLWRAEGSGLKPLASMDLRRTTAALAAEGRGRIGAALASRTHWEEWRGVQSVCLDASGDRLLVGTRGSEIYEVDLKGKGVASLAAGTADADAADGVALLVEGHCEGELWGLATHPVNADVAATVGDEGIVRLWDTNTRVMLFAAEVGGKGRCAAFSDDGRWLAVGAFGDKPQEDGSIDRTARLFLFEVDMDGRGGPNALRGVHLRAVGKVAKETIPAKALKSERKRKKDRGLSQSETNFWVSDIRFAPGAAGEDTPPRLAVATHYRKRRLCVFELRGAEDGARAKLAPVAIIGSMANSSAILHVDWSADGRALQTDDRSYELLFWQFDPNSKKMPQIKSASSLRDTQWHTWSCVLGWPVQGIFPSGADGTDVNAVDRSPRSTLLATGDDFGHVSLFRYPCVKEGAASTQGLGHSSHVSNVRFAASGQTLLSAGGGDRTLMQWVLRR